MRQDYREFQGLCEQHRSHLPRRGVTTSAETASQASCRDRRPEGEHDRVDCAAKVYSGRQRTMV
jgi:hypothetical protein